MNRSETVLILGANGQLGSELAPALAARHGARNVVLADLRKAESPYASVLLDVTDRAAVNALFADTRPSIVYHLAAILSASGEKNPALAWDVNLNGLLNVLDAAVAHRTQQLFWPSSIAVFGPSTPRNPAPQAGPTEPTTHYGIAKRTGELLLNYYHTHHGLDVRSLRYPGLISYKTPPGGGTTDYAVDIFHSAKTPNAGPFVCPLSPNAGLPMLYMPDAVRATLELMAAPAESIRIRTSYNLHGLSFTPAEIAAAIQAAGVPLAIEYQPDHRDGIAATWPAVVDDTPARTDWGWAPKYDLPALVADMLEHLQVSVLN